MAKKDESSGETPDVSSSIVDDTLGAQPTVDGEQAVSEEIERRAKMREEWKGKTDHKGRPFDPEIHETNEDGSPKMTGSGNVKIRGDKRGRPHRQTRSFQGSPEGSATEPDPRELGRAVSQTVTSFAVMLGGERWKPITIYDETPEKNLILDEQRNMDEAWSNYFASKNVQLKPEHVLLLAMTAYAGPRIGDIASEAFKKRSLGSRLKGAFSRKKKDAQSNHRTNGVGEDHPRDRSSRSPITGGGAADRT